MKEYKYLGIVFDYSLKFDTSLKKVSKQVRAMNNYNVLTQDNLSITQKLNIWKTYFCSKLMYPLLILCITNNTAAKTISSQICISIKKCLGLNQCLPKEVLFTWLYELTPNERAELFLLRTLKKLMISKHKIRNREYLLSKITCCNKEEILDYMEDKIKLNQLKENIMKRKTNSAGISHGRPFETIYSKDLDWIRFSTKELDIFRWKNVLCNHCKSRLSTDHLKVCVGTSKERELITMKTGIEASEIFKDPSILNKRPDVKTIKSFVAERISKMVHSAGRRVIG